MNPTTMLLKLRLADNVTIRVAAVAVAIGHDADGRVVATISLPLDVAELGAALDAAVIEFEPRMTAPLGVTH